MKKYIFMIVASLAFFASAGPMKEYTLTLDISKDPVYSSSVYYGGGPIGIKVPTRDSCAINIETVAADLPAGAMPDMPGIATTSYKLELHCAENSSVTVASDHSGSSNDFNGNTTTDVINTTGVGGYGFDLDAYDGTYFTRADDADFDTSTGVAFTWGFWFKHAAISTAADYIINKSDGTGNTETGYAIYMDSDGDLALYVSDDGGATSDICVTTSKNYDDAAWHLAVLTCNATDLAIYVDGMAVTTISRTNSADATLENSAAINIGALKSATNIWEGSLDSIFFINGDVPTAIEVREHYNMARAALTPGDVKNFASTTTTTDEYIEVTDKLWGYRGYIRVKAGAAQTADRTFTIYKEE